MAVAALLCVAVLSNRAASAEQCWVDDEQVLRSACGWARVRFEPPNLTGARSTLAGLGMNLEEAAGLGRGIEIGVRFGLRFEDTGRVLRADEVARGFDTETFGTGLKYAA